jgi:hypothetical protein
MFPRSLPNSERKIIALLLFLNLDAFTPCVAPKRQGGSKKEIRLGALRVANRKHMNSVAPSAMVGSHRESIRVLLEKLLRMFSLQPPNTATQFFLAVLSEDLGFFASCSPRALWRIPIRYRALRKLRS